MSRNQLTSLAGVTVLTELRALILNGRFPLFPDVIFKSCPDTQITAERII